ncbi:hypothetical protein ACFFUA_06925 [Streptomyces heliomycini]|uniref:Uncharacterized protein n=1 Tax=Streptomyces heliomycini TaxID=284032 RepID=A0ABV5L4V2_9ACTN
MSTDIIERSILASFHRLTSSERSMIELLSVYRTLDVDIIDHTARALGADQESARILRLPMIEARRGVGDDSVRLRPLLRQFLLKRLRDEDPVTYHRAHRLAAAYFHQPLEPLMLGRLGWYLQEIHHLAVSHPGRAFSRLADFSHSALMAGHPEAASRGAAEALQVDGAPEELKFLADVVRTVSEILASPAQVDERAIIRLDGILTASRPSSDLAALRIAQLARDLVTYYSVRLAPLPRMSTALAPAVLPGASQSGLSEVSTGLSLAEAVSHFPHSVMSRVHKVEFQESGAALHSIKTTLYTQRAGTVTYQPVDLFPAEAGDTLDSLDVRDANGWTVHSLKVIETQIYMASAVSSWLNEATGEESQGGSTSPALRQEISRSLASALQDREHETVGQLLQTAADQSDGNLRRRILSATQYLPLVAVLDANSGTSQKLQYEYEGPFQVKRLGFSGVSVSLELVLPTQVKNRLEIPRLDGLELAEFRMESEVPYTLAANSNRHNWPQSGTREVPNQFTVVFSRDNEGDAPYGRLARANPHLLYVVRKEDIVRVRQVNLVCIAACLLAIFVPYALNGAVWSNIFSWLTMILILVDAYYKNPKSDPGASNQELRATASRPIKSILGVNVLSAVVAASTTNAGASPTTLAISATGLGLCLLMTSFLHIVGRQRNRLIRYPVLEGRM